MKRGGPLRRKKQLQADPDKTREWQDRSRQPLDRGEKGLKRTEFKRTRSEKKKEFEEEIDRMRPLVLQRSGGLCEARIPGICMGTATEVHHRLKRSQGGGNELANLLHVCGHGNYSGCHGYIETHRKECVALGLRLDRGMNPEEYPYSPPRRVSG